MPGPKLSGGNSIEQGKKKTTFLIHSSGEREITNVINQLTRYFHNVPSTIFTYTNHWAGIGGVVRPEIRWSENTNLSEEAG